MRKTIACVLAIVLIVTSLAVPAIAAEPRASTAAPSLSFDGTTAICAFRAVGDLLTDELEATISLYRGNTRIAYWTAEGDGYIFFSQTKTVTSGYTYTMKVSLTINGEALPVPDVSGTCP